MMKNTRYGAWSPKDWVIGPPIVGPIAQPIPKTVSYAPIILPEIPFRVLLRIISRVKGKNMLNPNPIKTRATPYMMIESETTENANPSDTAIVAAMRVLLVWRDSLPARASDTTLDTPKAKYKYKISVSDIPLSLRNAG